MIEVNLDDYKNFVDKVTSEPSKDFDVFSERLEELQDNDQNVEMSRLITAVMGMSAEAGEFEEIVKKMLFQGKPLDEDNVYHMKRELGDVIWYWMQACMALDVSPNEIISMNIEKLEARYPGGFEAFLSENRKDGDI